MPKKSDLKSEGQKPGDKKPKAKPKDAKPTKAEKQDLKAWLKDQGVPDATAEALACEKDDEAAVEKIVDECRAWCYGRPKNAA